MDLRGKQVTVALREAPLIPTAWGRHVGVPAVVVGHIQDQSDQGIFVAPIEVVYLNNGSKVEREKDEIQYGGIFVPWRSISSVSVH
ncbi:MAG: hypothetical protein HY698_19340 [Deltaproteobacteria bacterium]|nr:hypothetical protein [Deltaproteobacteria bacterium]